MVAEQHECTDAIELCTSNCLHGNFWDAYFITLRTFLKEKLKGKGDEHIDHKTGNVTSKLTWEKMLSLVDNKRNEKIFISFKRSSIF